MVKWVSATYSKDKLEEKVHLYTLEYLGKVGTFHIFHSLNGDAILSVFENQTTLLNYVTSNITSVFAIRLTKEDVYTYQKMIGGKQVTIRTIAKALVICPGSNDTRRTLQPNTEITIE